MAQELDYNSDYEYSQEKDLDNIENNGNENGSENGIKNGNLKNQKLPCSALKKNRTVIIQSTSASVFDNWESLQVLTVYNYFFMHSF